MRARRASKSWRVISLVLLVLLGGIAMGAALAVYDLSKFSPIPSSVMLLVPLLVGVIMGILTRSFAQALGAFLLTILVFALAESLALVLPELLHAHLGKEIALQVSVVRALTSGIIYILPLALIGIILGKIIARGD